MILKHFYEEKLAQASYLIGCDSTGEALVVDPNRDVEQYIKAAETEGLRITHVTETHIHADFVSGSRELAARTGATLYLSDEGDENWKYAFAEEAGAVLLRDGDTLMVGNTRIEVLHTPGHTPEHLIFLVTDTAEADKPMGAITGDFVFVGDVGRPDLLEKAAGVEGSTDAAARTLFRSLEKFKEQPDYLQVWPGHGAGSACGKRLSSVPQSTVGYERMFNWAFSIEDEDEFVRTVLAEQPEPPKYFAEMKRVNKEGPRLQYGFERPPRLSEEALAELLEKGTIIVDTRPATAYAAGYVPNTINIPLNHSFNTWAGWLLPYDEDFYLILDDSCAGRVEEAVKALAMVGLDRTAGYFGVEVVAAWVAGGRKPDTVRQTLPEELNKELGKVTVLDIRGHSEWEAGHLPGAENTPVGYLVDRLNEIPHDRPLVVYCQSGTRSAIAASVLKSRGFDNVSDLIGGYTAWRGAGYEAERGTTSPEPVKIG